jgi:TonB family protein
MKSQLAIACGAFALVLSIAPPLGAVSDEPILRVGHGVTAPRPVNSPDPEYSEEARIAGLQGKCVLSLVVNSEGKPEDVKVSRRLGKGLDEKSIEAVRNWTFDPARKDGKPVAVRVSVVVTFRIGKNAMDPDARAAFEKAQKAGDDFRRNAWKRVYRVEPATTVSVCHAIHEDGQGNSASILGLNEARQYRLQSITFTDNKTITNAAALRALFPIRDGESFELHKVATGLRQLKTAYGSHGFVSFKAFVDPVIDELHGTVALRIKCDEGHQFFVDHVNIAGLDEKTFRKLRKTLYVMPGSVYNERLADLWLEKNSRILPADKTTGERVKLDINETERTLVMTYDFTRCGG